jgi:glycine dehydrogenase
VQDGHWSLTDNPLVHAPHTQDDVMDAEWNRGYSPRRGGLPIRRGARSKLWPSVNRIDDVYGDRNLFCSCVPTEDYAK